MNAERTKFTRVTCQSCGAMCPRENWNRRAALSAAPAEPALRPLPDHDHHHNALKCPYCNPDGLVLAKPQTIAPAAPVGGGAWQALFWQVARELNCLPSTYVDGNSHVIKAAIAAQAARTATPQPAAIERLTDERATAWGRLYTAANSVVALAGYKDEVSTRDDELSSLMDALAGLDGGQWCPGLTPARAIERELSRVPDGPEIAYATGLAKHLHAKHFPHVTQWKPLPDLLGLLTQIDNMVAGIAAAPTPGSP